jgi:hypothetical protein
MRKVLPILVSIFMVVVFGGFAYFYLLDDTSQKEYKEYTKFEGDFIKNRSCKRMPLFLAKVAKRGVYIDLSQVKYKGVAFWFGRGFRQVAHKKDWEKFGYFGTYTTDKRGDLYLAPTPFITIEEGTFEAQKWIYKLDGKSGELMRWLKLDDVLPSGNNPYGIVSLDYDCDDDTLWVSSIDQSSYEKQRGKIYKIDIKSKKIIKKYGGHDFFTIKILKTSKGKYLLAGSAVESALYAWEMKNNLLNKEPSKLLELPDSTLKIRKIHVSSKNRLKLEAIPFSYSLVVESSKKYRTHYIAIWDSFNQEWIISSKK